MHDDIFALAKFNLRSKVKNDDCTTSKWKVYLFIVFTFSFCLEQLSRAKQLMRSPRVFVDADAVQNISG